MLSRDLLPPLQLLDLLQQFVGSIHLLAAEFEAKKAAEEYADCDAAEEGDALRLAHFSAPEDVPYNNSYPDYDGRKGELDPLGVELLELGEFLGCRHQVAVHAGYVAVADDSSCYADEHQYAGDYYSIERRSKLEV